MREESDSFGLIFAIRTQFPDIPVLLLTGNLYIFDEYEKLKSVGVYLFSKMSFNGGKYPVWNNLKTADNADADIKSILLDCNSWITRTDSDYYDSLIKNLKKIVGFANPNKNLSPDDKSFVCHSLGHIICDGLLSPSDIEPHLPDLRKVLSRMMDFIERDEDFKPVADFILSEQAVEDIDIFLKP